MRFIRHRLECTLEGAIAEIEACDRRGHVVVDGDDSYVEHV
jgi:hypothetical protein